MNEFSTDYLKIVNQEKMTFRFISCWFRWSKELMIIYGHEGGDEVLIEFVKISRDTIREMILLLDLVVMSL